MIIKITDKEKGTQTFNLKHSPTIEDFLTTNSLSSDFSLVATVEEASRASGYRYSVKNKDWSSHNGWAYILVIEGRVSKIGMTEVTLSSRFSSYQAGTKKARSKGTCSVTNFYCSEVIRKALSKGAEVEIYAMKTPESKTELNVLGEIIEVRNKIAYMYEAKLLEKFEATYGFKPILCNNSSLKK
jgi:hypothetical protein